MITVRKARNWKGQPGYRWVCTECPKATGFHHFDRWTDWVRPQRDPHPWERAMTAAICHHHRFHKGRSFRVEPRVGPVSPSGVSSVHRERTA